MLNQFSLGSNNWKTFEQAIDREWLVTNGIGGFATGTVGEINTRRYHGLLMAALTPPVNRNLLVAALDATVRYDSEVYKLYTHEFADGTIDASGYQHIESFQLDHGVPVWRYNIADALLEKRIMMVPGENTTQVQYRVLRARHALDIELMPLCSFRDYHSHGHGWNDIAIHKLPDGFDIEAFNGAHHYRISCNCANFRHDFDWYRNFKHREESARGLDDTEDLFRPGFLTLQLEQGEQASVVLSAETAGKMRRQSNLEAQINSRNQALLDTLPADAPRWIQQLTLAADQFIVERYQHGQPAGKTIIAGYPWFSDWGRDTMIALPGLTLATSRHEIAASILRTFAAHISEGMLPNRFPDSAEPPEYNTVDATLWYFHAVFQYTRHSADPVLATELYPLLVEIIDYHRRGTRHGIRMDQHDGLLTAGEEGVQLTWMDARVGDWVVTGRIGKAVEINALWYNALQIMATLSITLGHDLRAIEYQQAARQVKTGFQRFWNETRGCLYDVIDGPEGEAGADGQRSDNRIRPNQLFAVSLPFSPLTEVQQKSVVDVCARTLLTPFGLRSLARGEAGYCAHYQGSARERDAAYHQGTVWAWLIGAFVDAHFRVYRDPDIARSFLEPLGLHLTTACMGSISEIFDAEPPYTARGCFAQAWSVAEVLRTWLELYRRDSNTHRTITRDT